MSEPNQAASNKSAFPSRQAWTILWVLNVLTHVGYALVATKLDPFLRSNVLYGDAEHMHFVAKSLAEGGSFDLMVHRAPLFPLMMAGIYALVGPAYEIVRVLNGVLMVAGCALMMPLVKQVFGHKTAWWFLLAYTFHPLMIYLSGWLYTEALMITLCSGFAWGYYEARKRGYPLMAILGLGALMGLISLTRSTGIVYAAGMALWMLFDVRGMRKWALAPLFLICTAAVIAPWTYRNYNRYHRIIPVAEGGKLLWLSNNDWSDGREVIDTQIETITYQGQVYPREEFFKRYPASEHQRLLQSVGIEWIKTHPGKFIALWPKKLYFGLTPISYSPRASQSKQIPVWVHAVADVIFGAFLIGVLYGAAKVWKRTYRALAPLWMLALSLLGTLLIFNGAARYMVPLAPTMCLFFACAVAARRNELRFDSETDQVDASNGAPREAVTARG